MVIETAINMRLEHSTKSWNLPPDRQLALIYHRSRTPMRALLGINTSGLKIEISATPTRRELALR